MGENLSSSNRFPIAGVLNVGVMIVMVVAWIALVFGFVMLGVGILAHASGGELKLPFGAATAEGLSLGGFLVALAALIVMVPGVIFICDQMRRVLRTLTAGEPFVPENAGRLTRIAIAIALMELSRYAIFAVSLSVMRDVPEVSEIRLSINLAAWVAVAVLFVLSQVFSEGARLREEEKMTI